MYLADNIKLLLNFVYHYMFVSILNNELNLGSITIGFAAQHTMKELKKQDNILLICLGLEPVNFLSIHLLHP